MGKTFVDYSDWIFSGHWQDYGKRMATCELCGQVGLRYHFEIIRHDAESPENMWVGSTCIKKFGVTVVDEKGNKIRQSRVAQYLHNFIKKQKEKAVRNALIALYHRDKIHEARIVRIGKHHTAKKTLSPGDAAFVLWRGEELGIDLPAHSLKISLRTALAKNELAGLFRHDFHRIAPALTPAQLRLAKRLRGNMDG